MRLRFFRSLSVLLTAFLVSLRPSLETLQWNRSRLDSVISSRLPSFLDFVLCPVAQCSGISALSRRLVIHFPSRCSRSLRRSLRLTTVVGFSIAFRDFIAVSFWVPPVSAVFSDNERFNKSKRSRKLVRYSWCVFSRPSSSNDVPSLENFVRQ